MIGETQCFQSGGKSQVWKQTVKKNERPFGWAESQKQLHMQTMEVQMKKRHGQYIDNDMKFEKFQPSRKTHFSELSRDICIVNTKQTDRQADGLKGPPIKNIF